MARDPLASGDPLAERRFAYAKAAAEEGDFSAAAELFEQTLERAPRLGGGVVRARRSAREARRHRRRRRGLSRRRFVADPADAQGARGAARAHWARRRAAVALPQAYVARLFDDYAPRFEAHLTGTLGYRAPALIAEAMSAPRRAAASPRPSISAAATGLMGEALRDRVDHLTGVDLSPAMIAKARERGVYDALVVGDAAALLRRQPPAAFDLIVAADSLVYIGDLAPLFAAVATALTADGLVRVLGRDSARAKASSSSRRCALPIRAPTSRRPPARRACEHAPHRLRVDPARGGRGDAPGLICVFERTEREVRA